MYINTNTLEYPFTAVQIIVANPHISFPIPFELPDGYESVVESVPQFNPMTHRVEELSPALVDDQWTQQWSVIPLTANEITTLVTEVQNELRAAVIKAVQDFMDAKVAERNYGSILSACTYATSTVQKFVNEAQACVEWRDNVWMKCYDIMDDVLLGNRPMPSVNQVLSELPSLVWPT